MPFLAIPVDRSFRELCLQVYSGLRGDATLRRLFCTMVFPQHTDRETGAAVLSERLLANLEDKAYQLASKHYVGRDLLRYYRATSGHQPVISGYDHQTGQARMVKDLCLDPRVQSALHTELATVPRDPVDFVTGHKPTRQSIADQRKELAQMTTERISRYEETQQAIDYLNAVPSQRARKAMERNGEAALVAAFADPEGQRSRQNMLTLRFMRDQPKQFFAASRNNRSRRLFPAHVGYGTLSKDIATIVGRDWYEFDLRSSQLAICAYLWNVPELIAFLETGQSIWSELCTFAGLDVVVGKPAVKESLYSLTFGASDDRICGDLDRRFLAATELSSLGKQLLGHSLLVALRAARDEQLAKIKADGGALDCYGVWISLPLDYNQYGKLEPNPRSVLATLAQAVEFRILSPVFSLARSTTDFYITHWAHDGFCLDFTDSRRAEAWIRRLRAAVDAQARELGVVTVLERTRDPAAGITR